MNLDFSREYKGKNKKNPLLMTEPESKPKNDFRRNIKLTDPIFYKIRALMLVEDYKQYELIDEMANLYIENLSEQKGSIYEYQIKKVTESEGENS